ncbi:ROK family protein [Agromyces sp. NPDC056965]|uniref:ROK family transcriptional regulator n=1 Tax=Agromyces sp. NPDC056965 TaxID=3345983 RepID=UPI00363E1CC1
MALNDMAPHEARFENLRLENMERCFLVLRDAGASTVADLAEATAMSRPTVRDRLQDLTALGLVMEIERVVRSGQSSGRPASRYMVSPVAGFVIAVEIGKHGDRMLVCDVTGTVRARYAFTVETPRSIDDRMETLAQRVAELRVTHAGLGPLLGLGATVPGTLTSDGLMARSPVFPEWAGRNIQDVFDAGFDVPVVLQNDLNAAAIAEHRHGAATDFDDVALALVWHQLSVGLIINGALYAGHRSMAGEINQLRSSMHSDLQQALPSMPEFLAAVDAAEAGDKDARELVEHFARVAGEQIAGVLATTDPAILVLYGAAAAPDWVSELVTAAAHEGIDGRVPTPIVQAELGDDAAVTGALIATLDDVSRRLFGETATPAYRLVPNLSDHPTRSESQTHSTIQQSEEKAR